MTATPEGSSRGLTAGGADPVSSVSSGAPSGSRSRASMLRCAGYCCRSGREFPSEPRQAHRPVDEEQRASRTPASLDVAEHEPRRQAKAGQRLQAIDDETTAKQVQASAHPFDDQRLVPAANRTLRAVGPRGDQTEKAVQIEPAHGRGVSPLSKLALGEHALGDERNDRVRKRPRKPRQERWADQARPGRPP